MDTPDFPEIFIPTAKGQGRNLQELKELLILTGHLSVLQRYLTQTGKELDFISQEKIIFL